MIALVQQQDGSYVEEERGEPRCGRDFCDQCGDCLVCFGDDLCYGGAHRWVISTTKDTPESEPQP